MCDFVMNEKNNTSVAFLMVLSIYKVRIANAINQQFGILAVLFVVLRKKAKMVLPLLVVFSAVFRIGIATEGGY